MFAVVHCDKLCYLKEIESCQSVPVTIHTLCQPVFNLDETETQLTSTHQRLTDLQYITSKSIVLL